MAVIQLHLEHCVRQRFDDSSFDLDPILFGQLKPSSATDFTATQKSIVMLVLEVGLQLP